MVGFQDKQRGVPNCGRTQQSSMLVGPLLLSPWYVGAAGRSGREAEERDAGRYLLGPAAHRDGQIQNGEEEKKEACEGIVRIGQQTIDSCLTPPP